MFRFGHHHRCRAGYGNAGLPDSGSFVAAICFCVVVTIRVRVGVAVFAAGLFWHCSHSSQRRECGRQRLQVLFAQLGTLDGGDAGADNQQNTIDTRLRTAASVTTETGGVSINYIVIGLLQSRKIRSTIGVERSSAGFGGMAPRQHRNAAVFSGAAVHPGACPVAMVITLGQTCMVAGNAQITGDGAFTHIAVHKDYPLVGGCQRDGQVNGHVALPSSAPRSDQDGLQLLVAEGTQGLVRRDL